MDLSGLIISFGVWCFIVPVFYFLLILLLIISINFKLGDIRDSLEEISKISGK